MTRYEEHELDELGLDECPACVGTKFCTQCDNMGECPACYQRGHVEEDCEDCDGLNVCGDCGGTGECAICHGEGYVKIGEG
jgi:hypothetical protein